MRGVRRQMQAGQELAPDGSIRPPDSRQKTDGAFHAAARPAKLLPPKGAEADRQLAGRLHIIGIAARPASQEGAIGEVEIFRQRIGAPTTRVEDGGLAPNAGCAVEVKELSGA